MATMAITNNGNGTATFVAAGLSGTGTLFLSRFGGVVADLSFTSLATFSANGSQTLTLQKGPYFASLRDDGGYTAIDSFRVTDTSVGVHQRCVAAIRDFILGMSLPGVSDDPLKHAMVKKAIRTAKELGNPPGGVFYWPGTEIRRPLDNVTETVMYPVNMLIVAGNGGDNTLDYRFTIARELASKSFPRCPLDGVDEIHTVRVVPGVLYGELSQQSTVDLSMLTFECTTAQVSIVE